MRVLRGVFNKIKQIKPIQSEQKRHAKCWLQSYIMLCLERGFVPCGLNDLDPIITTTKILEKNTEILKKLFHFDLEKLQALIDFLNGQL